MAGHTPWRELRHQHTSEGLERARLGLLNQLRRGGAFPGVLPGAIDELWDAGYRARSTADAIRDAQKMLGVDHEAAVVFVTGQGDRVELPESR